MSLASESKNEIIERVLHQCSKILYSDDREHTLIALHAGNLLRCNNDQHCFDTKYDHKPKVTIMVNLGVMKYPKKHHIC